jgi:hypothetical protein
MATNIWIKLPVEIGGGGGGGSVNSVSALSPLSSSGGTDPIITIPAATAVVNGYLSAANFVIFNSKQNALTLGDISDVGTDGISVTGGTGAIIGSGVTIAQQVSDATHNGYLSASDFVTFSSKASSTTTVSTTAPLQGGGDLSSNRTLSITQASGSADGYLSAADFTTFAAKQAAGNYITALSSDVVASGPGSAAATIQSNVVSNSKLAQMAAGTLKGNNTASTADAIDLTLSQVQIMLGINNNIDGGQPDTIYTGAQVINGGTP